jgi:site-specific recombinase XerD
MAAQSRVSDERIWSTSEALIKSFDRHLRAENKRPQTIDHYIGSSRQFLDFCVKEKLPAIENISREHIELWLESLHTTYRPHSVRNRFIGLRMFFGWLTGEGEIERNPFYRRDGKPAIRPPRVDQVDKDVATTQDLQRVFELLDRTARNRTTPKSERARAERDALIIAMLYDTGMRAGELADLETENVNTDTGIVYIAKSKNHRSRVVRLSAVGLRYLDRYLRHCSGPAPVFLLEGKRGKMTRSGVYQVVTERFALAGVKAKIGPHDLRHTSASHVVGSMTESEMMQLYGWQDAEMARHYARQALEKAALDAHERASPLTKLLVTPR